MKASPAPRTLDRDVTELLRRGFYSMAFQPIREMRTGTQIGFEALLRGPHGTPLARPGALFDSASLLSKGVLQQLDLACIGAALRSGRLLPSTDRLFINVHGDTMSMAGKNGSDLFSLMDALEVHPSRVVLEISETTDATHVKGIARLLADFRRRGVQIALDDVGVRYPWLHHLLYLEPEYVKVDRAFVRNIHRIPRKAVILHGLRDLAARAGACLIAEGIETEDDWKTIESMDVPYGQGFWLGRPSAAETWAQGGAAGRCSGSVQALYTAEPMPEGREN